MVVRSVSIPLARPIARPSPGVLTRVSLPVLCLLLVVGGLGALGVALGRLPPEVPVARDLPTFATLRPPEALDALTPAPETSWPRSPHPIAGFAFVRCTNLWVANADGSNPRHILSMPGIASPTFSPDGRTIAFLRSMPGGTEVWLAAADGSASHSLGTVASGDAPVHAHIDSLAWSPDGTRLAFTVMPAAMRGGTTTHWLVDLPSGEIHQTGGGGDVLAWLDRQVLVTGRQDGTVRPLWGNGWTAKRLSQVGGIASVAFGAGWWASEWEKDTAVLFEDGGDLRLGWKSSPGRSRIAVSSPPPAGFRFDPSAEIAVVQHGSVAVTLLDGEGERDLGLFDPVDGTWRILDYAWDADASPAPPAIGPLEERRAVELVQDLLWQLGRREGDRLLLRPSSDPSALPFLHPGFTLEPPRAWNGGWRITVHAFGRTAAGFAARDVLAIVRPTGGRLAVRFAPAGRVVPLRTIEDAVRYLERVLTVPVLAPTSLPAGTRLAARPVDAWSWRGRSTGSLHLVAPGGGRFTIYYGDGGLGCGAYPVPVELSTGTSAILQDPAYAGGYNAVAWPAGPNASSGPFGIQGELPITTLVAMASAMDVARLDD